MENRYFYNGFKFWKVSFDKSTFDKSTVKFVLNLLIFIETPVCM